MRWRKHQAGSNTLWTPLKRISIASLRPRPPTSSPRRKPWIALAVQRVVAAARDLDAIGLGSRLRLNAKETPKGTIVDGEDKSHPLSDDQLVTELAKHGITVARRTVTKYRKAMNIPSSRQRRDWSSNSKE